ncbi:HPP family protein [Dyadobacter fermentans DSM 18053]|uniref:HPP family protein n=1 Tax=Dyadobacter fermentans (strain ATCC 700827 / DSM 18053 / CIP 107007 / KCTC 52180 / NS114) TaxID=471854 RepID=C6W1J6_DYAFD|nr:HPP family protein [Dyadobacter fermentans DSM 18053]
MGEREKIRKCPLFYEPSASRYSSIFNASSTQSFDILRKRIKRNARLVRYVVYKETLIDFKDHFWTFLGSFLGIGIIGLLNDQKFTDSDSLFLIGSFGASSVLIYGIVNSPLAQPRNLIGGHVICALVGVTVHKIIPDHIWLSSAFAVSISIVLMQVTKTLHPPGGATALIANIGSEKIKALGYMYVLNPVLSGVLVLLFVAVMVNRFAAHRKYPANRNWYKVWERKYFTRI